MFVIPINSSHGVESSHITHKSVPTTGSCPRLAPASWAIQILPLWSTICHGLYAVFASQTIPLISDISAQSQGPIHLLLAVGSLDPAVVFCQNWPELAGHSTISYILYTALLSQTGPPIPSAMFVKLQFGLFPLWLPDIWWESLPLVCDISSISCTSKSILLFELSMLYIDMCKTKIMIIAQPLNLRMVANDYRRIYAYSSK